MEIKITDIKTGRSTRTDQLYARLKLSFHDPQFGDNWQEVNGAMLFKSRKGKWFVSEPADRYKRCVWSKEFQDLLGKQVREAKIPQIVEIFGE